MIILVVLLIAACAIAFMARSAASEPLGRGEQLYLLASPIPLLLAIVFPALTFMLGEPPPNKTWSLMLTRIGIGLSLALALAGPFIAWTSHKRTGLADWRLVLGLFVASLPALILLLAQILFLLPGG
jgi:hypothetical protein